MTKLLIPSLILILTLGYSCKKEVIFEVDNMGLALINADKKKQKTTTQFVSILYANLFQKALSASKQVEVKNVIESIGDKKVAYEILISNFLNEPDVLVPSDSLMLSSENNLDGFITESYNRFLVRQPTEAERTFFQNYINQNAPGNTKKQFAELVYFAFALCDEYQYY
jgi:hypothetical protein